MADAARARATATLLAELQAEDPRQRWRAAAALGSVRTAEAAQALARALYDPQPFVRWAAAQALGEVAGRATDRAVPVLVAQQVAEAAAAADPGARAAAADALAAWGRRAPLEPLLSLVRDSHAPVRAAAARALGLAGNHSPQVVLPSLLRALEDADPEVRRMAANAIAWCREAAAEEALVARLSDPVAVVRAASLRALARASCRNHEAGVLPLLRDADAAVRAEAVRFLRLRGGAASLRALAELEGDAAEIGPATLEALAWDARLHIARRLGPWHELRLRWRSRRQRPGRR